MRKIMMLLSFTGFLVLAGCVQSLQPLYTEEDLIFDPALLGAWAADGETWEFDYAQCSEIKQGVETRCRKYKLVITDLNSLSDGHKGEFEAYLVLVDGVRFLDLFPHELDGPFNDLYLLHWVPVHTFWRVYQVEPSFKLALFAQGEAEGRATWLENFLKTNPTAISHGQVQDRILLTAPPKELQTFLMAHLEEGFVEADTKELQRQPKQEEPVEE